MSIFRKIILKIDDDSTNSRHNKIFKLDYLKVRPTINSTKRPTNIFSSSEKFVGVASPTNHSDDIIHVSETRKTNNKSSPASQRGPGWGGGRMRRNQLEVMGSNHNFCLGYIEIDSAWYFRRASILKIQGLTFKTSF